jgi:hypothetical protein
MVYRNQPVPQVAQIVPVPTPHKGINAITSLMEMDPQEAIYAYNVICNQDGLNVRPGYGEWCTGLGADVRTLIPVKGNATANDKLFSVTSAGIYDCTASSGSPSKVVTFGTTTGNSGWGTWEHCTNLSGDQILMYCDEVNGYYTYDTATSTWTQITQAFQGTGDTAGTALTIQTTVAGTITVGAELYTIVNGVLTDTGFSIVSGSGAAWVLSGSPALASGTAIAIINNSNQVYGANPAQFVFVRLFNNRVWFVQSGSGNAWYLPVGQVYGILTQFGFGNKFPHGGNLNSLWTFTYGSYFGTYLYLVGVGDAGDVIAYTGSDPNSSASWSMAGQWYVGDLVPGRRCASNYGGDLTILCSYGAVNLSSLFYQKDLSDPNTYITKKIAPAIRSEIAANQVFGWSLIPWPGQNALIITDPDFSYQYQFCYALTTNGWSVFKNSPMECAAVWHGNLYAGTPDGRVVIYDEPQDNMPRAGGAGVAIQWGVLGAFSNLKMPGVLKIVDLIRPYFVTQQLTAYNVFARFDFDITDLVLGSGVGSPGNVINGWDSGIWDSTLWGASSLVTQNQVSGQTGTGRYLAAGMLGASNGNTVLVGYEASVRKGSTFLG